VRQRALAQGLATPEEAPGLSTAQLTGLLLRGGISTSGEVSLVSGRGIGLDVVRDTVARLNGLVTLESREGQGTTVELSVPVSLSSLDGLLVEVDGAIAAVPLDAVRRTLLLRDEQVARTAQGESIVFEGQVVPFVPLLRALRRPERRARSHRSWPAVVVQHGQQLAALGVDRLLGTTHVVVRRLPPSTDADPVVAGASLDAEGDPQLVLDPAGLVAAAALSVPGAAKAPSRPAPILVIDDSLTTRMLVQSILEAAGYDVELATSAEEALAKAHAARYSLFLVDVEMPGMDGFEFVRVTRADSALREVPAVLVTSRSSAEDQLRGQRSGAAAYVVKSDFDQGRLLQLLKGLVG
jgi:two-component system chemotaxis sensor kinase CheA